MNNECSNAGRESIRRAVLRACRSNRGLASLRDFVSTFEVKADRMPIDKLVATAIRLLVDSVGEIHDEPDAVAFAESL